MQKQSKYGNEEVFVVPYQNTLHIENGFTRIKSEKNIWSKFDKLGKYIYRDVAEGRPEVQQLIPYILIRSVEGKYLVAKRTDKTSEERWHNTISIGFGGHINPCDGEKEVLFQGAVRELLEEVNLSHYKPMQFIGYVRDMGTGINDHLGCVFLIDDVDIKETSIKEKDKLIGDWYTKEQLIEHYGKLETWAKHITNYLVENSF